MPSVIDRAVKALRAEGIATFDASEDEVSLAPSAPDGFRVALRIRGPDVTRCIARGGFESFARPEDAFDCFLFALSDRCRLRITLRGATPVRWQVLRREDRHLGARPVRRRRLVPFWRGRASSTGRTPCSGQSRPAAPPSLLRSDHRVMPQTNRPQTFANHAHRPYWTWAASVLALPGFILLVQDWRHGWQAGKLGAVLVAGAVVVLVSISRVYITRLQNRIIRLEMRLRLKEVLPATQQSQIPQLETPQLVALRFASDEELPSLADRAIREHLSRDDIKKAIRNWVPDWERT